MLTGAVTLEPKFLGNQSGTLESGTRKSRLQVNNFNKFSHALPGVMLEASKSIQPTLFECINSLLFIHKNHCDHDRSTDNLTMFIHRKK